MKNIKSFYLKAFEKFVFVSDNLTKYLKHLHYDSRTHIFIMNIFCVIPKHLISAFVFVERCVEKLLNLLIIFPP